MNDAGMRYEPKNSAEHQRGHGRLATLALMGLVGLVSASSTLLAQALPEAPDRLVVQPSEEGTRQSRGAAAIAPKGSDPAANMKRPPCPPMSWAWREQRQGAAMSPCQPEDQMQYVLSTAYVKPLPPRGKGELAAREVLNPFTAITIIGASGINVAADSHTAYGPGLKGWGRLTGYSYLQDATGEFFGTFLIPTLAQEDPRYHRLPGKPLPQRLIHAVAHTVLSQHDDGSPMPNYATLVTYPVTNVIANLYVPGIQPNASSTAKRIALGYASDPIGSLIDEFLPDVAKHVHVRIVFVQQIINRAAAGQSL